MTKAPFVFFPNGSLWDVVERFDDVEMLHGHMSGNPKKGNKFVHKGDTFKIIDIYQTEYRKTVLVERVL